MNGALRFFAIAFLLALCYHWLGDDDWTDMEEETDETQEDLINKFTQSFHRKSGDQVVKGENGKFKADLEELHSSKSLLVILSYKLQCLVMFVYRANFDRRDPTLLFTQIGV